MKTYTQKEIEDFPAEDGAKQCPAGHYERCHFYWRSVFGRCCSLGDYCIFGSGCTFGGECTFGSYCRFGGGCILGSYSTSGRECDFDSDCTFGDECIFGSDCTFGSGCTFGGECTFGNECVFGSDCTFASGCRFGSGCTFGSGCSFGTGFFFESYCTYGSDCRFYGRQARTSNPYIAIDRVGSENRKTYIFDLTDGLYVRSGCFFGTLQQFREKVLLDDETQDKRSTKTLVYLGFANLACAQFNQMENVQ